MQYIMTYKNVYLCINIWVVLMFYQPTPKK